MSPTESDVSGTRQNGWPAGSGPLCVSGSPKRCALLTVGLQSLWLCSGGRFL